MSLLASPITFTFGLHITQRALFYWFNVFFSLSCILLLLMLSMLLFRTSERSCLTFQTSIQQTTQTIALYPTKHNFCFLMYTVRYSMWLVVLFALACTWGLQWYVKMYDSCAVQNWNIELLSCKLSTFFAHRTRE